MRGWVITSHMMKWIWLFIHLAKGALGQFHHYASLTFTLWASSTILGWNVAFGLLVSSHTYRCDNVIYKIDIQRDNKYITVLWNIFVQRVPHVACNFFRIPRAWLWIISNHIPYILYAPLNSIWVTKLYIFKESVISNITSCYDIQQWHLYAIGCTYLHASQPLCGLNSNTLDKRPAFKWSLIKEWMLGVYVNK